MHLKITPKPARPRPPERASSKVLLAREIEAQDLRGLAEEHQTSFPLPGPGSPEAGARAAVSEPQEVAGQRVQILWHDLPSPSRFPPHRGRRPVPLDD